MKTESNLEFYEYSKDEKEDKTRNKIVIPLLQEYDDLIISLQNQLDMYREFHDTMRQEVTNLLLDNQDLTAQLNSEFKQKIKDGVEGSGVALAESHMVLNLRKQLELRFEEKTTASKLYEASLKALDKLESEITLSKDNIFVNDQKDSKSNFFTVSLLESKIDSLLDQLENEKETRRQMETDQIIQRAGYGQLKINSKGISERLKEIQESEECLRSQLSALRQDHIILRATYDCVSSSRNELQTSLEGHNNKIYELERCRNEANEKVEEAVEIAEKAVSERDRLLEEKLEMQQEVQKLESCLEYAIEEAGKKTAKEIELVKKSRDENIAELLEQIQKLEDALKEKTQEVTQAHTKYEKIRKEASKKFDKQKIKFIRGSETELTILESQLSTAHRQMEILRIEYEESAQSKDKLVQLEKEHSDLQEETKKLKNLIEKNSKELEKAKERALSSEEEVLSLQKKIVEAREAFLQLKSTCSCEELTLKLKAVQETNASQVAELIQHVELQMKVDEKWRKKVKEIIERFEDRINEVTTEAKKFKFKNKKLRSRLFEDKSGRATKEHKRCGYS